MRERNDSAKTAAWAATLSRLIPIKKGHFAIRAMRRCQFWGIGRKDGKTLTIPLTILMTLAPRRAHSERIIEIGFRLTSKCCRSKAGLFFSLPT